jgi:hypothetical protein
MSEGSGASEHWNPYLKFFKETMAQVPPEYNRVWNSDMSEEERDQLLGLVDMDKALSYAWAIPDERALQILAHHSPIVEIGGGTGYWARCLAERGADVVCYDSHPPEEGTWAKVLKGGPEALQMNKDRTLFLCYPGLCTVCYHACTNLVVPPDDFEYSEESMALSCLNNFVGDTVILVGEALGQSFCLPEPWGRSTAPEFQVRLATTFHKVLQVSLPCWNTSVDSLSVWKRTRTCITEDGSVFADIPEGERLELDMCSPSTASLLNLAAGSNDSPQPAAKRSKR